MNACGEFPEFSGTAVVNWSSLQQRTPLLLVKEHKRTWVILFVSVTELS
jgi:hypothetical protein